MKIDEDNEMSFLVQYMDTTNLKELAKVSKNQEKRENVTLIKTIHQKSNIFKFNAICTRTLPLLETSPCGGQGDA